MFPQFDAVPNDRKTRRSAFFAAAKGREAGKFTFTQLFLASTLVFYRQVCYNKCMEKLLDIGRAQTLLMENKEKLDAFRRLLLEYNERYNLTAITEEEEICCKHFLDSAAGESLFPAGARVLEVGSGAGFPSVPLMLVRPDLSFTLIESTGKKCDFLSAVKEKFSLPAKILHIRAEDGGRDPLLREQFDVCCARAVARLNTLSEYCLPFVREGGAFLAYKGAGAAEEVAEAKRALSVLGGGEVKMCSYSLPGGMGERTIVFVRKTKPTPAKYPRGRGKERSAPL